jgi:hypothetical protein
MLFVQLGGLSWRGFWPRYFPDFDLNPGFAKITRILNQD